MSIGRGELTDWLKAFRDFVDLYNPHLPIFSPLLQPRKINGDEGKGERETEREGGKRSRRLTSVVDGGWWNGSYFGNLGSQEWAGIVLTALFSHSL